MIAAALVILLVALDRFAIATVVALAHIVTLYGRTRRLQLWLNLWMNLNLCVGDVPARGAQTCLAWRIQTSVLGRLILRAAPGKTRASAAPP